jgi:hypothetical protein
MMNKKCELRIKKSGKSPAVHHLLLISYPSFPVPYFSELPIPDYWLI